MELCEERWNYGLAPLLLLIAGIALFIRTKTAIFIYDYYRRTATEGKISLESPSVTSLHSSRSSSEGVHLSSYDEHRRHHQHHQHRTSPPSSTRPRNNTTSSAHSRSSSSSTVRPFRSATASRIMLLPPDYQNQQGSSPSSFSPSLHITPPSPHLTHSNSSCDSIDTVKGVSSCSSNPSFSNTSRKRAMSHDSGSDPYNHVVVYAPVLMSIEEAQQLGGKEAVIASASASASGVCSSPTNYASASPRLRNVSPPGHPSHPHQHHRHQQHHPSPYPRDTKSEPKRSDSEGSSTTIMPDNKTPVVPPMSGNGTSPFAAIKGYRDTTEMDDLASATKNA